MYGTFFFFGYLNIMSTEPIASVGNLTQPSAVITNNVTNALGGKPTGLITIGVLAGAIGAAILYTPIASIGIDRYLKCDAIQGDEKYDNRKMFLSTTLTVMITVAATLVGYYIIDSFSKQKSGLPFLLMMGGVMGIIASVFTYQLQQTTEECGEADDNSKNFVILCITGAVIMTVGGIYLLAKANPNTVKAMRNRASSAASSAAASAKSAMAKKSA
tara:strand:- start:2532 stop:3179 length:648 start_codon:yes stop_codon:yes gene_type:complete